MGLAVDRHDFSDAEFEAFSLRIRKNLETLNDILQKPNFGEGPGSVGAELEYYLLDKNGLVAPVASQLLGTNNDPRLTHELNLYNLEYNLDPCPVVGRPFSSIVHQINEATAALQKQAKELHAEVLPIGILPTLSKDDLNPAFITPVPRYRALSRGLLKLRGGPFNINIEGPEPLYLECDDVTVEGANTSFQFHWRVSLGEFVDVFNTLQLVTPLVLALATNSPTLLGHRLWEETRIALFKQSVDSRTGDNGWRMPARVPFGFGWLRESAYELFARTVALYPPLLAVLGNEDCAEAWAKGQLPGLAELRLHHGTVWPWNRGIYDPVGGGHLRIEMRALPAGPSTIDMAANAALLIGLAYGLKHKINDLLPAMPYSYAEYNFYRAAKFGLGADLLWPSTTRAGPEERPVGKIIGELLPIATEGLEALGVEPSETKQYLDVIGERLKSGQTGARWQLQTLDSCEGRGLNRKEALQAMLEAYKAEYWGGRPVSEWSNHL